MGKIIAMVILIVGLVLPFRIARWLSKILFDLTGWYWIVDTGMCTSLLAFGGYLMLYMLFFHEVHVSDVTQVKRLHRTLGTLNRLLDDLERNACEVRIYDLGDDDDPAFSIASASGSRAAEFEHLAELLSEVNQLVAEARRMDVDVSVDLTFWDEDKLRAAGRSERWRYRFGASQRWIQRE